MSLFNELKRRNVFKVAVAYAIVSWLLIQVIGSITPMLDLPDVFGKMVLVLLLIGFPIAVIFAWAFEMTPDGIKKDSEVTRDESEPNKASRKFDFIIIGALVLIIGGFIVERFVFKDSSSKIVKQSQDGQLIKPLISGKDQVNSIQQEQTLGVAVLPFENLSADPDNAFFAGGVYEDVLTYLSRIEQLRVISRTSMEKIAKQGMGIPEIGKYLDVSHVLEGSVRRAGNQVRVTVQLIKASNDEHVWAENYDRNLDDIFAIQTEIAKKIAATLKTQLSPVQKQLIESQPTTSIAAYDLFIKARELGRVWRGSETFEKQIPLLEKALQLDPDFVEAEVKLVSSYGRMAWTGADPNDIYRPKAEALKNKIVSQHPDTTAAFAVQGYYEYTINRDYQAAYEYFQQVLIERPNDAGILGYIAACYKRLGKFKQGVKLNKKLLSLDPEHNRNANELVMQLTMANRIDEALIQAKSNLNKFPDNLLSIGQLAGLYFSHFGKVKEYLKTMEQMSPSDRSNLYIRLTVNTDNIDDRIALLEKNKQSNLLLENANIDLQISELLNILGFEIRSQQVAKKALTVYQNAPKKTLSIFGNNAKIMNVVMSYLACLANDKTAFRMYDKAFQKAPVVELISQSALEANHALALAECGHIDEAWKILSNVKSIGPTRVTPWVLVLDPIYQHYFSKLPEFKALEKKLQQQKQAKKTESKQ